MVQLPSGTRVRGTVAWLTWLALHLVSPPGNRNRISVLPNLSFRYLTRARGAGLIIGNAPARNALTGGTCARCASSP